MMKLKSLIKITIFVIIGFSLLRADNNASNIINNTNKSDNYYLQKSQTFLTSLYNYLTKRNKDYLKFLYKDNVYNDDWERLIHNMYVDECIKIDQFKNKTENIGYAVVNVSNNCKLIHHFNTNVNNIIPDNITSLDYTNILKDQNFSNFFLNLNNNRDKLYNINAELGKYIDFCDNLYLQYTHNTDHNVISHIQTNGRNKSNNNYVYQHNISADREYRILMVLIYNLRDSFFIKCINDICDYCVKTKKIKYNDYILLIENLINKCTSLISKNEDISTLLKQIRDITNKLQANDIITNQSKDIAMLKMYIQQLQQTITQLQQTINSINLFTYQDMCPSCWSVWNKYIELARNIGIVYKNFCVDVYSIRPYNFGYHAFYNINQHGFNSIDVRQYERWYKRDIYDFPRRQSTVKYFQVNQIIDKDGDYVFRTILNNNIYNIFAKYYFYNKINDLVQKNETKEPIRNLFYNTNSLQTGPHKVAAFNNCIFRLENLYNSIFELINGETHTVQMLLGM